MRVRDGDGRQPLRLRGAALRAARGRRGERDAAAAGASGGERGDCRGVRPDRVVGRSLVEPHRAFHEGAAAYRFVTGGDDGEEEVFTAFYGAGDEPDNARGREHCAASTTQGQWTDRPCAEKRTCLCELGSAASDAYIAGGPRSKAGTYAHDTRPVPLKVAQVILAVLFGGWYAWILFIRPPTAPSSSSTAIVGPKIQSDTAHPMPDAALPWPPAPCEGRGTPADARLPIGDVPHIGVLLVASGARGPRAWRRFAHTFERNNRTKFWFASRNLVPVVRSKVSSLNNSRFKFGFGRCTAPFDPTPHFTGLRREVVCLVVSWRGKPRPPWL